MREVLERRFNRQSFWALIAPVIIGAAALSWMGIVLPAIWIATNLICVWRLHDIGQSGKWVLAVMAVQFIATVVVLTGIPDHQISVGLYAIDAVTLLGLVWLGSEPGERVSNVWGGPPAPGLSFGKMA